MEKKINLLFKPIENKTIVWFSTKNEYTVLENITADILKRLYKGIDIEILTAALSKKLSVPQEKSRDFILELEERFLESEDSNQHKLINDYRDTKPPVNLEFIKFYQINDTVFKIEFTSEFELYLVHPKFAHIEVKEKKHQQHFIVFTENNHIFLSINNKIIKSWSKSEIHFFQGKFSMEIIQAMHQKVENDWMGVFHASAVGNSEKVVLFLGDSGNGKSTSLALLQANGFTCVADDFVPIDAEKQEVYSFPASISIKKNSLDALLPIYPELATTAEYNFKRLNKIVRYLQPNNTDFTQHLPCNDLVFIKYEKNAKLQCSKINKIDAFSQLIPDSWLSPKKENAEIFLDWFTTLNCYQLTYSNNEEMIKTVSKIFNNDL
jgi:hypothetical protein